MLPAKGYIVRRLDLKYDTKGNVALRIHQPAGQTTFLHITESPDALAIDGPLERIALKTLDGIDTALPPTLTDPERDWFFDFDPTITLDNGTVYRRISDDFHRSRTSHVLSRKAVYKREEKE